jgi:nitrite reductase/ring-hydroxylating ferredoxin subunit
MSEASALEADDVEERFTVELDDGTYELPARCPHRLGYLSKGYVNQRRGILTCPLHYSKFCIRTGQRLSGPACTDLDVRRVDD